MKALLPLQGNSPENTHTWEICPLGHWQPQSNPVCAVGQQGRRVAVVHLQPDWLCTSEAPEVLLHTLFTLHRLIDLCLAAQSQLVF